MSLLESLTNAIYEKIKAKDSRLPQIVFDELKNLTTDTIFPRVEIDLVKFKSDGYISQRQMQWRVYYKIVGYTRDSTVADGDILHERTLKEKMDIANYGMSMVNNIYSILDDKQAGLISLPGFEMFGVYPEIWTNTEIIPKLSSFMFNIEAIILLDDTKEE